MSYGVLRPRDASGTTFLDLHSANTVGSPVTGTPTLDGSGREIGDVYTAVCSAVTLGPNTATVTVTTASAKGPYHNKVFAGVLFDGTTPRLDIVPGVSWIPTSSG